MPTMGSSNPADVVVRLFAQLVEATVRADQAEAAIIAAAARLEAVLCASIDGTSAERLAWCVEQIEMWAKEEA